MRKISQRGRLQHLAANTTQEERTTPQRPIVENANTEVVAADRHDRQKSISLTMAGKMSRILVAPKLCSPRRMHSSRPRGSCDDDAPPAGLVRRPTGPKRTALLGRSRLDAAPSAKVGVGAHSPAPRVRAVHPQLRHTPAASRLRHTRSRRIRAFP